MSPKDHGLNSISPLDGRYAQRVKDLAILFSEYGLIYFRVMAEIEYLLAFLTETNLVKISAKKTATIRRIVERFDEKQALKVKQHEATCRHDVKAVEYFLREELSRLGLAKLNPYIHFGLTSEDTNSIAYGLMLQASLQQVMLPQLKKVIVGLIQLAEPNASAVMMGRTHGQPAVPTTLGKELLNFVTRLVAEYQYLAALPIEAKCNGAVGNWHVHDLFFPKINWPKFSERLVVNLGLQPNNITIQIVPAESAARYFQSLIRINQILLDCARDCWQYISDDYLHQIPKDNEVGSSTMPQKINPIDFENAEGNAGLATALLAHFTEKLPISRLQRDLSDSTVKRSIGVALGHSLLAMQSLVKGLSQVEANRQLMLAEVRHHPEMMAEAVQSALRLDGRADAYEVVKKQSRGKEFSEQSIQMISQEIKNPVNRQLLVNLKAEDYTGLATKLTKFEIKKVKKYLAKN